MHATTGAVVDTIAPAPVCHMIPAEWSPAP